MQLLREGLGPSPARSRADRSNGQAQPTMAFHEDARSMRCPPQHVHRIRFAGAEREPSQTLAPQRRDSRSRSCWSTNSVSGSKSTSGSVHDTYAMDMVSRATVVDKLVRAGVPIATAMSAVNIGAEAE